MFLTLSLTLFDSKGRRRLLLFQRFLLVSQWKPIKRFLNNVSAMPPG